MRFYSLHIETPSTGQFYKLSSYPEKDLTTGISYGKWGQPDYGALDVEFDIQTYQEGSAETAASVSFIVKGIDLSLLKSMNRFKNGRILFYGGFGPGFDTVHPEQAGLLFEGYIQSVIGNYVSSETSMQLFCYPTPLKKPRSFELILKKNASLNQIRSAVNDELNKAYQAPVKILKPPLPEARTHLLDEPLSLPDVRFAVKERHAFFKLVRELTRDVFFKDPNLTAYYGPITYDGLHFVQKGINLLQMLVKFQNGGKLSYSPMDLKYKKILYEDLLGQPALDGSNGLKLSLTLNLRADLFFGGYILLPPNLMPTMSADITTGEYSGNVGDLRNALTYTGYYIISGIRHVGSFRNADGANGWTTIIECIPADNKILSLEAN